MDNIRIYKDIQVRTGGEIYLGIVGPVRTGKSTFIKRFMELMVLPKIQDEHQKRQMTDELPQAGTGKTIMTTEPKFVPKEAADIMLGEVSVKIRLVDCVGYLVDGAVGYEEEQEERLVKTPWFQENIPFSKAADIGTHKVIHDHATIGIVVTTDGSIGELKREQYEHAEEKTIGELKEIGKPFVVLLNSTHPYAAETKELAKALGEKHKVSVLPVNCEQLKTEDIDGILKHVLYEFPIGEVYFYLPKWLRMLPMHHPIKQDLILYIKEKLGELSEIKDALRGLQPSGAYMDQIVVDEICMDSGLVKVRIGIKEEFYYEMLSEWTGTAIRDEYDLMKVLKEMSQMKQTYGLVEQAMEAVTQKGYGVVSPKVEEIELEEPTIIKQGSRYGVKIHSHAPSIHMIRASIETELAPIVGSESQAQDLIRYIQGAKGEEGGIWKANIFGKSMEELVLDSMRGKLDKINDESQVKLQDTMQKIVNDSNGGLVCIII